MSAAAVPIYKLLVARGVDEAEARQAAEDALVQSADELLRLAQERAEKAAAQAADAAAKQAADAAAREAAREAAAQTVQQVAATFVSKDQFHDRVNTLATREEMNAGFARMEQRMDRIERRLDSGNRLTLGVLLALLVLVVNMILAGYPPRHDPADEQAKIERPVDEQANTARAPVVDLPAEGRPNLQFPPEELPPGN